MIGVAGDRGEERWKRQILRGRRREALHAHIAQFGGPPDLPAPPISESYCACGPIRGSLLASTTLAPAARAASNSGAVAGPAAQSSTTRSPGVRTPARATSSTSAQCSTDIAPGSDE